MKLYTDNPTVALAWWETDSTSTIMTDDRLYWVGTALDLNASWRIISPEELESRIKEQG